MIFTDFQATMLRTQDDAPEPGHVGKWREDIARRGRPGIRRQPWTTPKRAASRLYQLLSGRAMTAVLLKEGWGWTASGQFWCERGRQSREYLFEERTTWRQEIRAIYQNSGGRGRASNTI